MGKFRKIRANFFKKEVAIWGAILLLALLLRLYGLDLNPVGITHDDELHEIINAKSLALTGSNVPGVVAGILTWNGHCIWGDCVYGELESYVLIPWMLFFPLGLVLSKIPFVFVSVILSLAAGKLFQNLSKNTIIGMIVGLLVALNPWAIYFGRTAYPQFVSHTFYIIGAYFFTRHRSYQSNLIFGSIFSFCASFFYFGAKTILPLIIIWGFVYNLHQFKVRPFRFTLLWVLVVSVIIGGYFLLLSNSYAGVRLGEIDGQSLRLERYLGFFSPQSLFLEGQKSTDNAYISNHGYYYLLDFPFLIFGLWAVASNFRNALFVLSLIIIAVMPVGFKTSETSMYSLRAALAYPLLTGIIGWGYYFCWIKLSRRFFISRIFLALTIIFYCLSLTYFLAIYWYRIPTAQSTRWFFHERVVANYITRTQGKNIIVVTPRPDGIFNTYVFYSGIYSNKNAIKEINSSYLLHSFEYNGVKFIDDCGKITKQEYANSTILIDQVNRGKCGIDQKNTPKIANVRDGGGLFNIMNESLCSKFAKNKYPKPESIYDYKVENLSDEAFCKIWITNPDL